MEWDLKGKMIRISDLKIIVFKLKLITIVFGLLYVLTFN
jgi:hypothetical protein